MKFRKRPVVIEAVQYNGRNRMEIIEFTGQACVLALREDGSRGPRICIDTLEGPGLYADEGDWIIKGVKNEFYPCKPDIFEATYEPVEEEQIEIQTIF